MDFSKQSCLIIFFLANITSIFILICTESVSNFILSTVFLLAGNFFSFFCFRKENLNNGIFLFNLVYLVYMVLTLNHFYEFYFDWPGFSVEWRDEYKFYLISESNKNLSLKEIFEKCFINRDYFEYGLYVFYISFLSVFSNLIDGNNSLIIQFSGTSFFGILTSIFLYKIFNKYMNCVKSFNYSAIFMLFSIFLIYSNQLLRDMMVCFLFTLGFYICLSSNNKKIIKLLLLLFINFLVFELRFEHGLFFLMLTFSYMYFAFKKNLILLNFGIILATICTIVIFNQNIESLLFSKDNYDQMTKDAVFNNSDSFAKYLYMLPPGLSNIAIAILSQIQPFPSWIPLIDSNNIFQYISGLLQLIYPFFWFTVFFSLIKWVVVERKVNIFRIDKKFLVILVIFIIFLLFNSVNISLRRIACFYPFVFLLYALIRENDVNKKNRIRTNIFAIFLYFFMILIYVLMK